MTDDADLASRFGDPAAVETAIQEQHDAPAEPLAPKVRRKATRVARAQIWDPVSNIRGVLGTGKAYAPDAIGRLTGQPVAQVDAGLGQMEKKGEVRRAGERWEMVFA